jgi:hypothetical protein
MYIHTSLVFIIIIFNTSYNSNNILLLDSSTVPSLSNLKTSFN